MLINDTFNDRRARREIEDQVGKKYTFLERMRMNGIGSQRMLIVESSDAISDLLALDRKLNHANVEIRKGGILVRFQSKMHNYAFAIPWHFLTVFRTGNTLNVFGQNNHVKLRPAHNEKLDRKFVLKLLQHKALWSEDHPTLQM